MLNLKVNKYGRCYIRRLENSPVNSPYNFVIMKNSASFLRILLMFFSLKIVGNSPGDFASTIIFDLKHFTCWFFSNIFFFFFLPEFYCCIIYILYRENIGSLCSTSFVKFSSARTLNLWYSSMTNVIYGNCWVVSCAAKSLSNERKKITLMGKGRLRKII